MPIFQALALLVVNLRAKGNAGERVGKQVFTRFQYPNSHTIATVAIGPADANYGSKASRPLQNARATFHHRLHPKFAEFRANRLRKK